MTPSPRRVPLPDLAALEAFARDAAARLPSGGLLVLSGPVGAGKTTFVRALAAALGSDADVTSPTYALVHEYPTPRGTLVHVDAYRLGDARALHALALDELAERAALTVVEWGAGLLDDPAVGVPVWHLALDRAGTPTDGIHGATWHRAPPA